ncbi:hypothetical protein M427DRAFT_32630 [Gonapodya prolifera JEL478]|uniref:MYND-type domain-containing protein n=1 Tax=Gonapodya prolifera (strain JEL478) TaxID=1344416 RepID=A0A139AEG0_GONPJ|nr:hypothetical protein M427DRAFT_32630 [Gonapodya prolifera JEL478]|eukprot:KXS15181.1 hypothetical protein M427DRAFT_32630 [Gonapodya prolifera JEL478]
MASFLDPKPLPEPPRPEVFHILSQLPNLNPHEITDQFKHGIDCDLRWSVYWDSGCFSQLGSDTGVTSSMALHHKLSLEHTTLTVQQRRRIFSLLISTPIPWLLFDAFVKRIDEVRALQPGKPRKRAMCRAASASLAFLQITVDLESLSTSDTLHAGLATRMPALLALCVSSTYQVLDLMEWFLLPRGKDPINTASRAVVAAHPEFMRRMQLQKKRQRPHQTSEVARRWADVVRAYHTPTKKLPRTQWSPESAKYQACGNFTCVSGMTAEQIVGPTSENVNKCKMIRYCSVECQKVDWRWHKVFCAKKTWPPYKSLEMRGTMVYWFGEDMSLNMN